MGTLLDSIAPLARAEGTSIKSRTVHDDVERTLQELAMQPSNIDLGGAVQEPIETERKVSFVLKPTLRSFSVETKEDVETEVQRLVGGEAKVTIKF